VDRICDQIIIIARGRMLVHDTLNNLKKSSTGVAEVVLAAGQTELQKILSSEGMPAEVLSNGHVRVELPGEDIAPVLRLMRAHGIRPLEIIPSPNALEEIFVKALADSHDSD
jgi:ABC-type multidrug transport system ATPase subunit